MLQSDSIDLKLVITDALYFFKTHIGQIAILCLPWLILAELVDYLIVMSSDQTQGAGNLRFLSWIFHLLVYPIYTAALIFLMAGRAARKEPGNAQLTASAVKIWQPFFVLHIMMTGLTYLGLFFCIVPGVFIAIRLAFAPFYFVLENLKPLDAVQKSFRVTQATFFQILLLLSLFWLPVQLFEFMLIGFFVSQKIPYIFISLVSLIADFILLFIDVLLFRFFMSVKQEEY